MATVAEFTINDDEFPLGGLFNDMPGVNLELERVVPTNKTVIPYVWVHGATLDDIEERLGASSALEEGKLIDDIDDTYLIRLKWKCEKEGVVKAIVETGVTLLSGGNSGDHWTFEIRGDDRDNVSAFQHYCRERGIPITLTGLHALSRMRTGAEYDLTDAQRDALTLAYEHGYFQSPRAVTLDEIAGELGITGQSLGSRIRRGTHRLIGSTLIDS